MLSTIRCRVLPIFRRTRFRPAWRPRLGKQELNPSFSAVAGGVDFGNALGRPASGSPENAQRDCSGIEIEPRRSRLWSASNPAAGRRGTCANGVSGNRRFGEGVAEIVRGLWSASHPTAGRRGAGASGVSGNGRFGEGVAETVNSLWSVPHPAAGRRCAGASGVSGNRRFGEGVTENVGGLRSTPNPAAGRRGAGASGISGNGRFGEGVAEAEGKRPVGSMMRFGSGRFPPAAAFRPAPDIRVRKDAAAGCRRMRAAAGRGLRAAIRGSAGSLQRDSAIRHRLWPCGRT